MTGGSGLFFELQITFWLWLTVLFANFAEAMAEGRGKAQADTLRKAKTETVAKRERQDGSYETVPAPSLRKGDIVRVAAGEVIPADGEIIEGVASVDESAITGESAPVIRESGGDRSAVTGGTKVLSDWIRVKVTVNPGETFLDRMIALVEGAERQKTPNEIALNILLAGLTIVFLIAVVTLQPFAIYSGVAAIGVRAGVAARVPHPDDHRRPAVGDRHRRHGSSGAAQRAGDVGPGGRSRGRRPHAAARQDGHDHARQPSGHRVHSAAWHQRDDAGRRGATGVAAGRDTRRPIDRRAREGEVRPARAGAVAPAGDGSSRSRRRPGCLAWTCMRRGQRSWRRARRQSAETATSGRSARALRMPSRLGPLQGRERSPEQLAGIVQRIARAGGTPLVVADGRHVLGVIHLKDIVKGGIRDRFAHLRAMGIKTVMITGDNPLTAAAIASEAGVDDFLAQATPEDKMALIKREQADGKLVAMTGDGTNDAPALAQADVGVAMNTGTQAAKEAGNMVDLDSNPTKLIEVVEIGKQLLITRGALTTFSIANDVAKYFAIIPAMFLAAFPLLGALNIMGLRTPQSAILSAVIFNALIIVALVPLALKGVKYRPEGAAALLRRNLLIYGVGGIIVPFIGIKAIDVVITALGLA